MSRVEFDIFVEQTLRNGPDSKPSLPAGATSPQAQVALVTVLLSRWSGPEPSSDLTVRILHKIHGDDAETKDREVERHRPLPWLWRSEWWAAAASVAALFGILIPLLNHSRNVSSRQACQFNIASIGQGLNVYRASFAGELPYVPAPSGATWAWTAKNNEPVAPNTRNPFLLVKHGFIQPQDMICPAAATGQGLSVTSANLRTMNNFDGPHQFSYSFHNMSAGQPNAADTAQFALLADRNPVFMERCSHGAYESRCGNSPNHESAGQNVLYHDGHTEWHGTYAAGAHQDNIWTSASKPVGNYEGTEAPAGPDDSFLVP